MRVKAIGIDLDDTLYDRYQIYKNTFKIMESTIIETSISFEKFNDIFQKYSIIEYDLFINGNKERNAYKIDRVRSTYKDLGHDLTTDQTIIFDALYEYYRNEITLRSKVIDVIKYLKEKEYDMFILTNGPSKDQRNKIETLGLNKFIPENRIFISDEINCSKPDEEIFKHVERSLSLQGREILYIGDHLENDVMSCAARSWNPIYFNVNNEMLACSEIREFSNFGNLYEWIKSEL